jgi:putative tricarboxylic transport membrane protein
MIDMQAMAGAISILANSASSWIWIVPGLVIGVMFTAIPALSPAIAMALFLPMTSYMDMLGAIVFLTSIWSGTAFGTCVPSILLGVPGSASSVATTFDGYPMTQRGEHNEALGLALSASTWANLFAYGIVLLFLSPLAALTIKIGPSELFIMVLWGLSLVALLNEAHLIRGLLSAVVGLLIGTIGMNSLGNMKGTMGMPQLLEGIPLVAAVIGVYAASEMFNLSSKDFIVPNADARKLNFKAMWRGFMETFKYPGVVIRGSLIGSLIGAAPGVGASVSNLLSYYETRRNSKRPEAFGTGIPEGVIAAEAANASSEGGSMATLFAVGIPGGAGTAMLLTAFSMHNVSVGPRFINDSKDVIYAIILNNIIQGFVLIGVGLVLLPLAAQVVRIPLRYIIPSVLGISVVGSYAYTGSMFGPWVVGVFSILGWALKRYGYSIPALVIGLLLGRMAEDELVRTLQISGWSFHYLLERPATAAFFLVFLFSLAWPEIKKQYKARRSASKLLAVERDLS